MHFIRVVHPHRHPNTLVASFVSVLLERSSIRSLAASALRSLAKKNLAKAKLACGGQTLAPGKLRSGHLQMGAFPGLSFGLDEKRSEGSHNIDTAAGAA
jgi:hypothetical protein